MDVLKTFVVGIVTIGLITAFGLHATGLASLTTSAGKAGQGLLGTAETGQASG
jgi:hypothetical protein